MTTTSHFQVKPDFYNSKKECENKSYQESNQSNTRYKNFKQTHFTAGDEEQFIQYMEDRNSNIEITEVDLTNNLFLNTKFEFWDKFQNLEADSIFHTFRYIFNKFKKGVYIKIANNKLKVFLPFSNPNYINEWSSKIKIDTAKYTSIEKFLETICINEGRKYYPNRINKNVNEWFGNNSLVRYEYPISEGEKTISLVKVMFEELCKHRTIPNISFFYNRRDFPLLTKDETEPYNHMWGTKNLKLLSHNYPSYCPILSGSSSERFADILIPTWDDWARVENFENKWYKGTCRDYNYNFNQNWLSKKPTAVFRGSTTGSGVDEETNSRLKACLISSKLRQENEYLDVGITKWNLRPRKNESSDYLETIDINKLPFKLSNTLSPEEQSNYKYILNIDGHVAAYRLSVELSMYSVVLLVQSDWKLWYSDRLIPYKHYVPIKSDLSDLVDQIKWCRENDELCEEISKNARKFYELYLNKKGIFDYLQKMIVDLKSHTGYYLYNSLSITDTLIQYEYSQLDFSFPYIDQEPLDINLVNIGRTHGELLAVEWLVRRLIKEKKINIFLEDQDLIFENKLGKVTYKKLLNFNFAIKTTSESIKIKEHIHETFIGTKITNSLSNIIPNFVYVFGLFKENNTYNVITEKIDGETLFSYLRSKEFKVETFLFILIQIFLSLQVAQNQYGFVHYDLTPWNIMLKKQLTSSKIDYLINYNTIFHVNSDIIPVIIDYGKSHGIYNDVHHGFVKPFAMSTCQDYLTLLLNSVNIILTNQNLSKSEIKNMFILSNFISNTKYRPTNFNTVIELKNFCRMYKKYSNLLDNNKYELEELSPLDFVNYILKNITSYKFSIYKSSNLEVTIPYENPNQIYNFFYNKYDISNFCINFIEDLVNNSPQPTNNCIFNYYILHKILFTTNNLFLKAVNETNQTELEKIHGIHIEKLKQKYLCHSNYTLSMDCFKQTDISLYDDLIFIQPKKVLKILSDNKNIVSFHEYREMILLLYLNKDKYDFIDQTIFEDKNILKLLKSNIFKHIRYICDIESLQILSNLIYTQDLRWLESKIKHLSNVPDYCKNYIYDYNRII